MRITRRATPARRGSGRRWRAPWARCSSAPTSAASGCTSRCCRAGYDGRPTGRTGRDARPRRPRAWPSPTPTATRRSSGSTCTCTRASGSPCSAPTAPARPHWCCTSTASCRPSPAHGEGSVTVSGLPVTKKNLQEIRRRVGIVFQDPDDQLFMGYGARQDVAFGPANLGLKGAALEQRVMDALEQVGMAEFADRPAAPPLLRPASPGRRGDRPGDGAGDPGARRAELQPRPGLAPRARRHPAGPRRDAADGHPRPALRAGAVPALGLVLSDGRSWSPTARPSTCSPTTP